MLIIEDSKYLVPIFKHSLSLNELLFIGWWNELGKKFIIGQKENMDDFINLLIITYQSNHFSTICAVKKGNVYRAFIKNVLRKKDLITPREKILYQLPSQS